MRQATTLLLSLLLAALFSAASWANAPVVALEDLKPGPEHRRSTHLITHLISNYHYRNVPLDDALSKKILDRYIDSLDPARSYFTQADIDEFQQHATRVDDYLRSSSLNPLFDMFVRFRQRLGERVNYAIKAVDGKFDFKADESFEFDRKNAAWPKDTAELDELWRKRVKNDILSLKLAGKAAGDITTTLKKRYDGLVRRTAQLNSEDVFQTLMIAYTTAIDPHTAYFSPRTSENFKIRMSLSLEGIGAVLQSDNELTVVREVVPGGPADLSGKLHADDRIVGIGQDDKGPIVDVIDWRLDDVVELIRGPKNSVVRLQVLPKGTALGGPTTIVAITRNTIQLEEQAAKGTVIDVKRGSGVAKIGIITLPTFYMDFEARSAGDENYRSTTRDVRKIIDELTAKQVEGLVIDLRANGGGSLTEATELTGLFIGPGPVVQVRDSQGRVQVERSTEPQVFYKGPLAVLVDRNSASASEIFAGAIQDYHRGMVVGEPTFGKGTVQNLVDLNRYDQTMNGKLGQLKATIAQFFRVSGSSTQYQGVIPDVPFPTVMGDDEHGERSLDNALPWAAIDPARFTAVAYSTDRVATVRKQLDKRIASDSAFQALLATERAVSDAQAQKSLSLREDKRRAEHDKARADQRTRENQIRQARGLPPLPADAVTPEGDEEEDEFRKPDDKDKALDVILTEAGNVLTDWIYADTTDKRLVDNDRNAKPAAKTSVATPAAANR
ncbi:MAG: carboxy terminal-processing peptidase [Proteobacteria bacterium]|jgi:carboxyl-terminal processing protease|nr:carboxy terminal-processing peptidase [Pseudomonadota bacterium]